MSVWALLGRMVVVAGIMTAGTELARGETYKVDPVHSTVLFKTTHMNVSNFYGRINAPTGMVVVDAGDPTKSSVDVSVKVEAIDTANAKRDEHLKGPDFFNAKQFPTISFKSTAVKNVDDKTLDVTGDLTLHGVTKSITVKLVKVGEGATMAKDTRAGFEAVFTIKRSDYGMNYMLQGGVGDDVTLTVSLEAIKQ